ncbi:protein lin-14 [Ditylenchus destructor]|uniref:Protein lin-14 n=1 Tax=Ditylenchus destructor TaxID=166010 RepID=A0AAD4R5U8_9BILA|nr:protein lin-14 [Ditylenchus destructor]
MLSHLTSCAAKAVVYGESGYFMHSSIGTGPCDTTNCPMAALRSKEHWSGSWVHCWVLVGCYLRRVEKRALTTQPAVHSSNRNIQRAVPYGRAIEKSFSSKALCVYNKSDWYILKDKLATTTTNGSSEPSGQPPASGPNISSPKSAFHPTNAATSHQLMLYVQQQLKAANDAGAALWSMKDNGGGGGSSANNDSVNHAPTGHTINSNGSGDGSIEPSNVGSSHIDTSIASQQQSCSGCRELKREVEDLRRMICQHFPPNNSQLLGVTASESGNSISNYINTSNRNTQCRNIQAAQSPPSPPLPPAPVIRHPAQCPTALSFNSLANSNAQQLLPWLVNNGLLSANNLQQMPNAQNSAPNASATGVLRLLEQMSPTMLDAALMGANRTAPSSILLQSLQHINNAVQNSPPNNNSRLSELVQAAAALQHQNSNNNSRSNHIGYNTNNNHASVGLHGNIDPVGVDGASETSSSASSTNTQLLISPQQQMATSLQQQFGNCNTANRNNTLEASAQLAAVTRSSFISAAAQLLNSNSGNDGTVAAAALLHQHAGLLQNASAGSNGATQQLQNNLALHASLLLQQQQQQQRQAALQQAQQLQRQQAQHNFRMDPHIQFRKNSDPTPTVGGNHSGGDRGIILDRSTEKRRAASDDYVRTIRQQNLSEHNISKIAIPVAEAFQADPLFRPLSEQQVVQQVMQSKKYENVNISETMAQLCKKLAEKRVFGSRLMSQTTVAAPNHSSYNNLPNEGIVYIQHVCRKVLGSRVKSDEEFWEYFREAMRKLAARCRRVRHAKKMRSPKVSVVEHSQQLHRIHQPLTQTSQAHQILFDHHRSPPQSTNVVIPPFSAANPNYGATFEPISPTGNVGGHNHSQGIEDVSMEVAEAESSSSPSPQTPMSSSTHNSTPTPTSVLADIKVETLGHD